MSVSDGFLQSFYELLPSSWWPQAAFGRWIVGLPSRTLLPICIGLDKRTGFSQQCECECECEGREGREGEGADTELKTKTPHVNVGKNSSSKPPSTGAAAQRQEPALE